MTEDIFPVSKITTKIRKGFYCIKSSYNYVKECIQFDDYSDIGFLIYECKRYSIYNKKNPYINTCFKIVYHEDKSEKYIKIGENSLPSMSYYILEDFDFLYLLYINDNKLVLYVYDILKTTLMYSKEILQDCSDIKLFILLDTRHIMFIEQNKGLISNFAYLYNIYQKKALMKFTCDDYGIHKINAKYIKIRLSDDNNIIYNYKDNTILHSPYLSVEEIIDDRFIIGSNLRGSIPKIYDILTKKEYTIQLDNMNINLRDWFICKLVSNSTYFLLDRITRVRDEEFVVVNVYLIPYTKLVIKSGDISESGLIEDVNRMIISYI